MSESFKIDGKILPYRYNDQNVIDVTLREQISDGYDYCGGLNNEQDPVHSYKAAEPPKSIEHSSALKPENQESLLSENEPKVEDMKDSRFHSRFKVAVSGLTFDAIIIVGAILYFSIPAMQIILPIVALIILLLLAIVCKKITKNIEEFALILALSAIFLALSPIIMIVDKVKHPKPCDSFLADFLKRK